MHRSVATVDTAIVGPRVLDHLRKLFDVDSVYDISEGPFGTIQLTRKLTNMRKLELVRLVPGRFDVQALGPANTTSLMLDDNNVVHATMRSSGDRWALFGIVDAVRFAPVEPEPKPVRK